MAAVAHPTEDVEVVPASEEKGSEEDIQKHDKKERWPLWKLIVLASPQFGVQILWCFIGPNSAPYMSKLGMPDNYSILNNMAGPITGFFTGPFVGSVSDNLTSRFGRRRPVILFGLCSLWVAGTIFAGAEHVLGDSAIFVAAPMYWVLDVTINILQTPHRALVADLASEDQQIPLQVVFVVFMSVGNFAGYSIMNIYEVAIDHMFTYMFGITLLNTVLVGIQFVTAKEQHLKKSSGKTSCTQPLVDTYQAAKDSPPLLHHLAVIMALVWAGNTAWSGYAGWWFEESVYDGDQNAPDGSIEKQHFADGQSAFVKGGQIKAILQLVVALSLMAVSIFMQIRPKWVFAPLILVGVVVSVFACALVGHNGTFAIVCMALSVMPETGSFSVPFGIVASLNQKAEQQGKAVSTALQMAMLNCCVTVGQQLCTIALGVIASYMSIKQALPLVFALAAATQGLATVLTLVVDDSSAAPGSPEETSSDEDSSA